MPNFCIDAITPATCGGSNTPSTKRPGSTHPRVLPRVEHPRLDQPRPHQRAEPIPDHHELLGALPASTAVLCIGLDEKDGENCTTRLPPRPDGKLLLRHRKINNLRPAAHDPPYTDGDAKDIRVVETAIGRVASSSVLIPRREYVRAAANSAGPAPVPYAGRRERSLRHGKELERPSPAPPNGQVPCYWH